MDNVSIISISSTASSAPVLSQEPFQSVGFGSSCPTLTPAEDDDLKTLVQIQRVNDWISSCKIDDFATNSPVEIVDLDDSDESEKNVCIRYDFGEKPPKVARITPLVLHENEPSRNNLPKNNVTRPHMMLRSKSVDFFRHKTNGNSYDSDAEPASNDPKTLGSPENRKKEFCRYLQLMNLGEKKQAAFLTNRRSLRVKNLTRVKEKRKLNEANLDDFTGSPVNRIDELNMKIIDLLGESLDSERRTSLVKAHNKYLPLPPRKIFQTTVDFDNALTDIIEEVRKSRNKPKQTSKIKNIRFNREKVRTAGLKRRDKLDFGWRRVNSLRSKGRLRHVSLDTLILRKSKFRHRKRRRQLFENLRSKTLDNTSTSSQCEIVTIGSNSDDENVDLRNFVDDMLEIDKLSEEHRKSLIASRIYSSTSIVNLFKQKPPKEDLQKACKIFTDISNENYLNATEKTTEEAKEPSADGAPPEGAVHVNPELVNDEHNYSHLASDNEEDSPDSEATTVVSPVPISVEVLPVGKQTEMKSLHRSLTLPSKRKQYSNNGTHGWASDGGPQRNKNKLDHVITISTKDGAVLRAFYVDHHLILCQEFLVSLWTQSALGNVLGAQNMWIPNGRTERLALNTKCVPKEATEMVISTEISVAYVELWTKEHKSDIRERPVADVFATVYFWRQRQIGLDKKALQLENIKGLSKDVQYVVLRHTPTIIVSWYFVNEDEKKTKIRSYLLAPDYQTVANIREFTAISQYVSSLHNIEDCENLVMGCSKDTVTLWNVDYGYIVASIELSDMKPSLSTFWVKCDRGFLFTVQECHDQELRLVAINGMNHALKKLQNYKPPSGFDRLRGVCLENGILIGFYSQGMICWNAQSGERVVEESPAETEYLLSGKYIVVILNDQIIVKHALTHIVMAEDF